MSSRAERFAHMDGRYRTTCATSSGRLRIPNFHDAAAEQTVFTGANPQVWDIDPESTGSE